MGLTHWKKLNNPDFLGAYSLDNGHGGYTDIIAKIDSVKVETVTGPEGKKEECIVCYFSDIKKPMVLNTTNSKMIHKLLETPYIEKWVGHTIQIGVEKVKAYGDVVEALRVRKFLPKDTNIKCEECKQNIIAANGMSADQLAEYTLTKYKKKLCAACARKANAAVPAETKQPEATDATKQG